jgi:hypothetical protein
MVVDDISTAEDTPRDKEVLCQEGLRRLEMINGSIIGWGFA